MLIFSLLAFVLIGLIAGLLAGLLGISGGVITIPLLMFVFSKMEFSAAHMMHTAIGTSFASMLCNAIVSMNSHRKRGGIVKKILYPLAPGIVAGVLIGASIAHHLKGRTLEITFGVFECVVASYFFLPLKVHAGEPKLPRRATLSLLGVAVGSISSVLGIGGGMITMPAFLSFRLPANKAVGTSSAAVLITTFLGAFSYLLFGLKTESYADSFGYIYIPAFICISMATLISAPIGAKLAQVLPTPRLRQIFAVVLLLTGILMVVAP